MKTFNRLKITKEVKAKIITRPQSKHDIVTYVLTLPRSEKSLSLRRSANTGLFVWVIRKSVTLNGPMQPSYVGKVVEDEKAHEFLELWTFVRDQLLLDKQIKEQNNKKKTMSKKSEWVLLEGP